MRDQLRVLLAAEHDSIGAAETYMFSLACGLAERGHQVRLLVLRPIADAAQEATQKMNVLVGVLPSSTVRRSFAAYRHIRAFHPDLVHANHAVSPVLIAARSAGVRARFLTDHVLPLRPSYGRVGRFLARLTERSTSGVVVFSRQNARLAEEAWRRQRTFMIHAGVPQPPCEGTREGFREVLGIDGDAPIVVQVGRLSVQKQHDVLIRAAAELHGQGVGVRVLIAGEGEERGSLGALIAENDLEGVVMLLGQRQDVGCVLGAADLYVQVSRWEGICFALLEAAACGVPTIVARIPALMEVVEGTDARAVEVGDVAGLAEAIRAALKDEAWRGMVSDQMRARWDEVFTVERMVAGHEQAYRAVLEDTGGRT